VLTKHTVDSISRHWGGQPLKIKYFILLLWLCLVSCGGGGPEAGPTIDATQRWLNVKCPPGEACAPEQSPEEIAQDYLEALIVGHCDQAAGYWLPERKDRAKEHCASGLLLPGRQSEGCQLIGFSSDETSIEKLAEGISFRISGKYSFECDQESEEYEVNDLILFFEEIEGEWYVAGFEN
jgi:hypothetical protein